MSAPASFARERLALDLRSAVRRLSHDWRFTTTATLILVLGVAANAAVFSAVSSALLRPPAVGEPGRLVDLYQRNSNPGGLDAVSYPAYRDIAEYTQIFTSTTAVLVPTTVRYRDGAGALRSALVEYTTPTYAAVLGVRPTLGRWFDPTEDTPGAPVVAVVGHQAWVKKFNADPSVLGRIIRVEGVPVTIVGVGPAAHRATVNLGIVTDFWLPVSAIPALGGTPRALERRPEEAAFFVKARLDPGVTVAQAQAAMDALGARLASEYPAEDPGAGIRVVASSEVRIHPQMDGLLTWLGLVLLGVVGFVLAIACSNLATLLLVRGAARAKDMAIRLALGASRRQLAGHLLVESLLLSMAGGVVGCLLAWWAVRWLGALDLPVVVDLTLDYRVLAFVLGLSLLTGVAFGLAPALEATRVDLVPTLRGERQTRDTGRRPSLKQALVVFQVAVSVLLLGGTGVFLQMLKASRAQRIGYAVDGVALIETDPRYAGYSPAAADTILDELRRRVARLPGVESAALGRGRPMQTTGMPLVVGDPLASAEASGTAAAIWAGPGYLETLRVPLLRGRTFDARDRPDTPRVAVISESLARRFFGTLDAMGRRVRSEQEPDGWYEVIGVAGDTGTADLGGDLVDPTPHLLYRSFAQAGLPPTTVLARTSLDGAGLVGGLQRELRAIDPALPVISATTLARQLDESLLVPKAAAAMLGVLGTIGLGLAALGLYAVVAFAVSQRSREIGIRMALGARSGQVAWSVVRAVAVLVGIGTAVGLVLSLLAIQAIRAVAAPAPGVSLYRPSPDPLALAAIAVLMTLVGLAAAYQPARRAARMDPIAAIRHE